MLGNIGVTEIALVLIIALVVFGPKRLPELGRSLGRGIREFRGSIGGDDKDDEDTQAPQELQSGKELQSDKSEPVANKRP